MKNIPALKPNTHIYESGGCLLFMKSICPMIKFNVYVTLSKYNIPLKCLLPSWHWHCNSFSAQDLKYELWHFVGGARLAQNLRLCNHCHFHKDLL